METARCGHSFNGTKEGQKSGISFQGFRNGESRGARSSGVFHGFTWDTPLFSARFTKEKTGSMI
jgi:hypothetical protein